MAHRVDVIIYGPIFKRVDENLGENSPVEPVMNTRTAYVQIYDIEIAEIFFVTPEQLPEGIHLQDYPWIPVREATEQDILKMKQSLSNFRKSNRLSKRIPIIFPKANAENRIPKRPSSFALKDSVLNPHTEEDEE